MKVLLLSRYGTLGASSRVRTYQYIPYLKEEGIDVSIAPLFNNKYIESLYEKGTKKLSIVLSSYFRRLIDLTKIRKYDLLWIEKELFPMLPSWTEELVSVLKIPYIVDYDDAIFHNYDLNRNILVRSFLKDKIDIVIRKAAVVVVGNDYLAERALRSGAKKVEYLPSVIDLENYKFSDEFSTDIFKIGWIGTPSTAKYLKLIQEALNKFCLKHNAKLILVGSGKINMPGVPLEIKDWKEDTEVNDILGFDVGIMPLPDEPWERGKCGYKLIQYMACGRPVVASPIGVNKRIVEHGINGFLASTNTDWIQALNILRDDSGLRKRMGEVARCKVEAEYCIQRTAPRLIELIRSIYKNFSCG
jgi:glycosyltransferase involved in cell wall biosynthesis